MSRLLLVVILFSSTLSFGQGAKTIMIIDFVQIINDKKDEALFFYENNWKVYRALALKKGFINSYRFLTTKRDSAANFDFMLITEYVDSLQFQKSEERFQKIIKDTNPNGPKLLNDLRPSDFRRNLFFKEGETRFSDAVNTGNKKR